MAAGVLVTDVQATDLDYGCEWQDLARLSEELRLAVCKIQSKLMAERQCIAAERKAAAADRAAAAMDREQAAQLAQAAERVSAAAELVGGHASSWLAGNRESALAKTGSPSSCVPLSSSSEHNAPCTQPHPILPCSPMPSRSPPPMPERRPPPVNQDGDTTAVVGAGSSAPRVKAPPVQGRKQNNSMLQTQAPSLPARVKEPPRTKPTDFSSHMGTSSSPSEGDGRATISSELSREAHEMEQEAMASQGAAVSSTGASCVGEAVGETDRGAAPAKAASSHEPREQPQQTDGASVAVNDLEDDLDDVEEEEDDEVARWAAQAPPPPNKAPPPESPHYRVMPPPPKATPLPDSTPLPPAGMPLDEAPSGVPQDGHEQAASSQMLQAEVRSVPDTASSASVPRVAVKAMPGRGSASSEVTSQPAQPAQSGSSAAAPWPSPVGKAAASRYKAPPTMLSQSSSSASSSDARREPAADAPPGSAGAGGSLPSGSGTGSSALPASRVKAPPTHR
eukprot:TRINITY_DN106261_c0_g1_i1.p1 TRINITY_DN106261_c0_g1~~TRINITY_DN106261_c0_g1_i1.p1  ORF type:complete len:507 (+),score=111.09 TRINITY_DN106261_c0_g1_i1:128-1648(+)